MKVREIMNKDVISVKSESTVHEIVKLMYEKKVSGLPVVDDDNKVIGIVSKSDLVQKVSGPHLPAHLQILGSIIYLKTPHEMDEEFKKAVAQRAGEIMTEHPVTVGQDEEVENTANIMVEKKINRIPVTEKGKLVGIITRDDIIKSMI